MVLSLRNLLLIAAVILFILVAVGFGAFHLGTVVLSLLGFGLACFAVSFLAG